ncbi:hypothetical protein LOZ53_005574 [Ophidiomyces ophidiicola]|nr:hypothetical protein LOZ55_006287 [Ophidiomyces ophidiicola]KAI1984115.1 hypothetical protein LOZ53_005574 [Ophidiomyces ophidiicola]KAI1984545.1 hypothetical protein LOZ51_006623 [Ophidiomyces ophidiicola]KAI1987809.1 hypothetical protein LOZ54_003404 [Ophidiomyces ophidiicola]
MGPRRAYLDRDLRVKWLLVWKYQDENRVSDALLYFEIASLRVSVSIFTAIYFKMNNHHDDTAHSQEDDSETLMKGQYEAMLSSQQRRRLKVKRRRLNVFTSICSIFTGVATGVMLILLLMVLWHQLSAKGGMKCKDIPDHPITEEEMKATWKGCGSNSAEARKKGCMYDVMLGGWIHADCYASDLMEKYISRGNYSWFRDQSLTIPMTDEEVRRGDHDVIWTRKFFHYAHCAYLWEMQMRAYREGKPIEHGIFLEEHTIHCAGILLQQDTLATNATSIHTGFEWCGLPWR